jgi:hypothetical protein
LVGWGHTFVVIQKIARLLLLKEALMNFQLCIRRRLRLKLIVVSLIGLLCFSPAWAKEAGIKDIVLTNTRDHLLLYFTVTDCFTNEMKKAIDNGINTSFTFFVKLMEVRSIWRDKKIADLKVNHEIQYDSLKKLYVVRLSERNNKVIFSKDFDEAKNLMSEIVGLEVTELPRLQKGNRYRVSMMAELDKIRLPFYLHYLFFFLSLWDFETSWYTVDFRY